MTIYAISDLHGYLPPVPDDCSLLLIAGDICPNFMRDVSEPLQQREWLSDVFSHWLPDCPVVAIWGNHDFVGESPRLVPKLPWTLLQDDEASVSGLRIYGTPWVPGLPNWAFYGDNRRLKARADAIPPGIDILMTHGPPHGGPGYIPTSDRQRTKYRNFDGWDAGDKTLNELLPRVQPQVTICGHIHEQRGEHTIAGRRVLNVSAVDDNYKPYESPFTRLKGIQ